jgi:hypothetical protein
VWWQHLYFCLRYSSSYSALCCNNGQCELQPCACKHEAQYYDMMKWLTDKVSFDRSITGTATANENIPTEWDLRFSHQRVKRLLFWVGTPCNVIDVPMSWRNQILPVSEWNKYELKMCDCCRESSCVALLSSLLKYISHSPSATSQTCGDYILSLSQNVLEVW